MITQEVLHTGNIMKITPVDSEKELEGSPLNYRGVTLVVARANNTNFKKEFRKAIAPFKLQFDDNSISDEDSRLIMITSIAKTILVGWSDFIDTDGKEWDYSYESAVSLLTDDQDAYDAVVKHSEKLENYLISEGFELKEA